MTSVINYHAHAQLTVFYAWVIRGINNTSYHTRHPCVSLHICTATVDKQHRQKYKYHFSSSWDFLCWNVPNQAKWHSGIMLLTTQVASFLRQNIRLQNNAVRHQTSSLASRQCTVSTAMEHNTVQCIHDVNWVITDPLHYTHIPCVT